MPLKAEIEAAAKAMVSLCRKRRVEGRDLPSRNEEAEAALNAAERVREQFLGKIFGEENIQ